MGFLSFNEKYYTDALKRLEGRKLDNKELYEAKQLLKLLDDLSDEGYTLLNHTLEEKYAVLSRLHAILKAHSEAPFPLQNAAFSDVRYGTAEMDIEAVCGRLSGYLQQCAAPSEDPFLAGFRDYCRWISWQPGTAYVFLLRDTFLPYLHFRASGKNALYPWVINRDFLRRTAGESVDDLLRLPVYEALESGVPDYAAFSAYCKPRIQKVLCRYPALERILRELLSTIREKKILVIESGYCGTIPLTLAALDERVDLRLYTTAPYLYRIYQEKIFCRRYEQIRLFETLYAQDALMKFSSYRNGHFYVKTAAYNGIWEKAAAEAAALQGGK